MDDPARGPWMEVVCRDCGESVVVARHPRGRYVFACRCSSQFLDRLDLSEASIETLPDEYDWTLVESDALEPDDPL